MNNLTYEQQCLENDVVEVTVSVVGAGAAAPTIPNTHKHVVASTTRSGAGAYVLTLKDRAKFPQCLGPVGDPCVVGADSKRGYITAIDADDGTITIQTKNNADAAATDLATTDQIFITLRYRNSKVRFGEALG